MTRLLLFTPLLLGLVVAGCDSGSRHDPKAATAAGSTQTPGSINVLTGGTAPSSSAATASAASAGTTGTATGTATGTTTTGAPGSGVAPSASGSTAAPAPAAPGATPIASTQAQVWGTIPPTLTTGFDGTLYLVGEKLVPGSVISVEVNGVWTKFLPATFHSSELLGVYVYLTVPADYTFTAVAPDGSRSTPVTFTVANGGLQTTLGLNPPQVHMAYPPSLDTNFSGTLWLIGDQFMPGSVALVSVANLPPVPLPLQFVNERTVGLMTATPFAGDITIQVSNPTFLTSQTITVTVGPAATPAAATVPTFSAPGAVTTPFVGTVHLTGTDLLPGAMAELRAPGGPTLSATPLIRVSSQEAWWTLTYPTPGAYEVRVVNPGGAAAPWTPFQVN